MTNYTQAFKTQNGNIPREHITNDGEWHIALDIGYSGVKGMSPNATYIFPSFARENTGKLLGDAGKDDILYMDGNGTEWLVGERALITLDNSDTNDSAVTLYGRRRYSAPMFLVLARVGIAMGMQANRYGRYTGQELFIQTGLPPAYLKADTPLLKKALAGRHVFSVQIGKREWKDYDFTIEADSIGVIEQPMGAVFSASKNNEGKTLLGKNRKPYIENRILVIDGGFGTFDTIDINNRKVESELSFTDVGMKEVFKRLSERLFDEYGYEVASHALQKALNDGYIYSFDPETRTQEKVEIGDILEDCNREICNRALDKLDAHYNYLQNYRYLLITGGTCSAWLPYIKERYGNMQSLEIIEGNQDGLLGLGPVYSNVRGYYIYSVLAARA